MESSRSLKYPSLASAFGASSNLLPIQAVRLRLACIQTINPRHQDLVLGARIQLYTPAEKLLPMESGTA